MDVRATVEGFLAALSAADVDGVTVHVTPDFHDEVVGAIGAGARGRDEFGERLRQFLGQFAGLHYEVVESIVEQDRAAVRYRLTANLRGHPIDLTGVMLFALREGRIARRTDVWDGLTLLRQTGVVTEM